MVKLSHLIALAAGLCLYTANAVTTNELPELPSISGLTGGGLYYAKVGGGGPSGGKTDDTTSGDGLTTPPDVTPDDSNDTPPSDDGTGDIPDTDNSDNIGDDIAVNDPTTVSNPFPKGGIHIHKTNKSSKNNKNGGNSVKDTNGQDASSVTTSTYLRG